MTLFIILNLLILVCFIRFIRLYRKLKTYVPVGSGKTRNTFPVIDVLFHSSFRDQPEVLKIQKRAVWAFCLALLLVHVSGQVYVTFVR